MASFLALAFVHGGIRWSGRPWYYSPFPMFIILFLAVILSQELFYARRRFILGIFLVFYLMSYGWHATALFPQQENQIDMYQMAMWAKDNLPVDARIAAFNSGILGYFGGRFVMNSDGLVNQGAYEAMKQNQLWNFFKKEKIDYIIDYEISLTYRYKSFLGIDNALERLKKADIGGFPAAEGNYGGSNLAVYEL